MLLQHRKSALPELRFKSDHQPIEGVFGQKREQDRLGVEEAGPSVEEASDSVEG